MGARDLISSVIVILNDCQESSGFNLRPFGTKGMLFRRTAVASKIALPMAGAMPMMGVSPAPAGGRSLRSMRIASISGTSRKRGTR